jgi:hypothetical protein
MRVVRFAAPGGDAPIGKVGGPSSAMRESNQVTAVGSANGIQTTEGRVATEAFQDETCAVR